MKLSEMQSKIVISPIGGAIQVLASAGSGKTRVLTERIRFILENAQKEGIIALTFTNKAADEMKDRLSSVDNFEDRCWLGTIHSCAQRIVSQYGNTIGLSSDLQIFENDDSRKIVFLESLRANNYDIDQFLGVDSRLPNSAKSRNQTIKNYLDNFSFIKRNFLTDEQTKDEFKHNEDFLNVFQEYQRAILGSGGIDFDDILVYAHRILLQQPWCAEIYRAKYKHVFVDEAQDLNRAQYEFIKALCGEDIKSVMMVGDPNQMIYGFNSSSHDYLCRDFLTDFSATQIELKENYRSSKAVIRTANKLKPGSQSEAKFALEGTVELKTNLSDEKKEAKWVVDKIRSLIALGNHNEIEGAITLEKIVVIGRIRFIFGELENELKARSIPYAFKKGERLSEPESTFGKILDLGIRVRLNSKNWVDSDKLLSALGLRKAQINKDDNLLKNLSDLIKNSKIVLADLQSDLLLAISELDQDEPNMPKLCAIFSKKIEALSTTQNTNLRSELECSLRELQELRACWTIFKKKGLGESLSAFRNALALGQLSEEHASNGVLLSTVHTMKGLEKDIVFLVGMCEGVFPDYRAETGKELEEEKNNAFVAVTRARRWLYITYPHIRTMPWGDPAKQKPSRFFETMRTQ